MKQYTFPTVGDLEVFEKKYAQTILVSKEMDELLEMLRVAFGQKIGKVPTKSMVVRTAILRLSQEITKVERK